MTDINIITRAVVRFTFEGFHHWSDAPKERRYLASTHRHIFHAEIGIVVHHNDREIEFHDFLWFCKSLKPVLELGGMSCEQIALHFLTSIRERYPGRAITVSIFEDGENGAVLDYKPE